MRTTLKQLRIRSRRPKVTLQAQLPQQRSGDSNRTDALAGSVGSSGPVSQEIRLTRREIQVLRLMAIGLQNKEIGAVLSITEGTVKSHVHKIVSKLAVSSRKEAIAQVLSKFL